MDVKETVRMKYGEAIRAESSITGSREACCGPACN
jgi:hypothetical protein